MIKLPKNMTREETINYVLRAYNINEIVETLVDLLRDDSVEPVVISKEQFEKFFKVRGIRNLSFDDGVSASMLFSCETRGRKKKELVKE